jgi:hypothetical protein
VLISVFLHNLGPSRHIAVPRDLGRFRGEADIERQARRAASVDNDP